MKFIVVAEVNMDAAKVAELQKWNVEPSDHVATLMSENARELGLIVKTWVREVDHSSYERLKEDAESYAIRDAMEELENEITSRACIGGSCED